MSTNITMPMALQGLYHIELKNTKTNEVKFTGSFHNVITDRLLDLIGAGSGTLNSYLTYLAVGSGNTTPTTTDTALVTPIGRVNSNGGAGDGYSFISGSASGSYWQLLRTRYFDVGVCTGNISEFGWYATNVSTDLATRSLIRDSAGTPITLVKGADDELRVVYEFRVLVPLTTSSIQAEFGPTTHQVNTYVSDVDHYVFGYGWGQVINMGAWGAECRAFSSMVTASNWTPIDAAGHGGSTATPDSVTYSPYIDGTYYRDCTITINSTNTAANAFSNGIAGLAVHPINGYSYVVAAGQGMMWAMRFQPPIPKPDTHRVTFTVRYKWGRTLVSEV